MSELGIHPRVERREHVDRAWSQKDEEAQRYGEMFARTYRPVIQEQLDGLQDFRHTTAIEYIDAYSDVSTGTVGGDVAFVREAIERRSYLQGLTGFPERPAFDPADKIDLDLSIEALENEALGAPYPEESPLGAYWLHQLARADLARLAGYWYGVGASDRLDESIARRRQSEVADEVAELELSMQITTAEDYFKYGMQDALWQLDPEELKKALEEREFGRIALQRDTAEELVDDISDEDDEIDHLYALTDEFYNAIVAGTYTADQLAGDARYRAGLHGFSADVHSLAEQVVREIRRENGIDDEASQ